MSISTRLITYEDSLTMPMNKLEEIVKGESRIMPATTDQHGFLLWKLSRTLEAQVSADYVVLNAGFGLGIRRMPFLTCRIPDLMVFRADVLGEDKMEKAPDNPYIWKTPELLVECLSPANRKGNLAELLSDYEPIAVPEVWLLDPKLRQLTAYRSEDGHLREAFQASSGPQKPARLPGVEIDLDQLWDAFHLRKLL